MNISCKDNENFEFERRIDRGCGFNFELSSDEVYQISYMNYIGDIEEQFYTMCPRCGYIIPIDKSILNDYEIGLARRKSNDDGELYLKNNILSEYTNVAERGRVRKKTL